MTPMSERLGDAHIQRFLGRQSVVVLATIQTDGSPLGAAMWFVHDPDALTMISVANTQKVRNLQRDPRVSVVAEGGTGAGLTGVTIQGRAVFLSESSECRTLSDRLLAKYDPHLERRWGGRAMPLDRVMFRIVPTRVTSWGLGDSGH
jgi:PPOX class probable F420-dependent enzyme